MTQQSAARIIDVDVRQEVAEWFYRLSDGRYLGYPIQKNPVDLHVLQNLIYDTRPDFLIETGTWYGGSALYYATVMDAINHGMVFTIDPWPWPNRPRHGRICYLQGSSLDSETVAIIESYAKQSPRVMVCLDAEHTKEHVLKELELYAPLVTVGNYLIVEDTNIHGHPLRHDLPEGPWEAVHEWLPKHPEFQIDHNFEGPFTNNPDGWLRRVKI